MYRREQEGYAATRSEAKGIYSKRLSRGKRIARSIANKSDKKQLRLGDGGRTEAGTHWYFFDQKNLLQTNANATN